jgi:hypothetical protein
MRGNTRSKQERMEIMEGNIHRTHDSLNIPAVIMSPQPSRSELLDQIKQLRATINHLEKRLNDHLDFKKNEQVY